MQSLGSAKRQDGPVDLEVRARTHARPDEAEAGGMEARACARSRTNDNGAARRVRAQELVAARGGLRAQGYTPNKRFLLNTVAGATQANRAQQARASPALFRLRSRKDCAAPGPRCPRRRPTRL